MDRRSFLRLMLASAAAEAIDFDKLLWVPKPIITVPGSVTLWCHNPFNLGQIVAEEWARAVADFPTDSLFSSQWLLDKL